MAVLIVIIIFVLIAAVVALVGAPLRRAAEARARPAGAGAPSDAPAPGDSARRDELEAAREAKYREIRDAELDFRTGKLSEPDYRALDGELRAEALGILDAIEALEARAAETD